MRKIKTYAQNISILFISVLISLIIIELFLRIFVPQVTLTQLEDSTRKIFVSNDYIPFSLKPNVTGTQVDVLNNEFDTSISINSEGFRGKEISTKKLNTKRIMIFGDSFTLGHGVSDNQTYSFVLEELLNKNGYSFEVINGGYAASLSPDSYYLYLKNEGINYKPDILILGIWVGNDISDISENEWVLIDEQGLPLKIISNIYYIDGDNNLRNKNYIAKNWYNSIGTFLWRYSHSYNFIKNKFEFILINMRQTIHGSESDCMYCKEYYIIHDESLVKMEKVIKAIKKISLKEDIKLIIMLIPNKEQVDTLELQKYKNMIGDVDLILERPQNEFKKIFKPLRIKYLDLLPDFQKMNKNNSLYFDKDVHLNAKGHELTAINLYEYLVEGEYEK